MRGYDLYNFPAFDAYADKLRKEGWKVISPADLDRQHGFDPAQDHPEVTPKMMREMIKRDVEAICDQCDKIFLMPGWQMSKGVAVELSLAHFLDMPVQILEPL
jgi:hypothetical protein